MIETAILTAVIAWLLFVVRANSGILRELWGSAAWWERALLVGAILPIPGPFDEIAGVVVARRIAKRIRETRP